MEKKVDMVEWHMIKQAKRPVSAEEGWKKVSDTPT